ncbi:MAG: response regulator transcription factor [Melioribacteraceae bacterium]|nr:response regulator transcription factor [Melioribacteraceae bacterium]
MPKIKVLLVDDHKMVREGIKSVINSREDLRVIGEASNGEEAIAKVAKLKPHVVVMDINMPGMTGIEAAKKIKEIRNETRILMLTMIDNEKFIIDALSSGADGYLYKDADISELLKAIRKLAEGEEYLNKEITEKILNYVSGRNLTSHSIGKASPPPLTPRETEIVGLISKGLTSRAVAEKLFISEFTVIKHRKNIIKKLDVKNFTEVVSYAITNGII